MIGYWRESGGTTWYASVDSNNGRKIYRSHYACPVIPNGGETLVIGAEAVSRPKSNIHKTYSYNSNLWHGASQKPAKITQVKRPSMLLLLADGSGMGYMDEECRWAPDMEVSDYSTCISTRHNNTANAVYADGHLSKLRPDDLPSKRYRGAEFSNGSIHWSAFAK